MTNQTISPNWCEDKCEDLSLINQLIVSRGIEHIPVRIFILQGSGEDVNLVVEKEKELFPNSVIFNKIEESSACLYFVSEDFAKNCSSDDLKNALYLDIHSIGKENLVKKLINELNIPEAENVISCLNNNTLNDLLEKDFNKILMKILLNYTKRTKGSAAFTLPLDNSDVSFLEPQIKETPVVEETPTVKENPKAEETSTAEETPRVQETPVAKSHDSKKTILSDALKFKGHKKIDEKPLFANETEEECEQETKVPKPKVTKTVKTAFKESLTPEEDANNKRLLEDIRNRYKTTISVIEDTKDSRFLSLKKEIKEALSKDS